ncbi:NEW3 domain-containing protein [Streptomyces sp. NBC_01341]|uniref:NEW3 domain-containing protein n=1 Tax=Streptomyces sp. NBC_01341 TaxID=2903831 RepID=UPI002E0EE950|nr:NEW3 domain-containing protein [Streptomyces sp. NBC_01341]
MRPARRFGPLRTLAAVAAVGVTALMPARTTASAQDIPATAAGTEVTIAPVDLEGPAISAVTVTVKNSGPQRLRSLAIAFAGPKGWAVQPSVRSVDGSLGAGASADASFRIQVPEKRPGLVIRTFTATATYQGGDGRGTATGTRTERSGSPQENLAAAYNNVGITDESATGPGDYDGEGNSFSAQRLAAAGLTRGAKVEALGAELTWPDVAAGTKDNVSSGGQAVKLTGKGGKLVLLGSGVTSGATGNATVHYTDGTSSTGTFGFPNWSFDPADAHGAELVKSTDGRNRPDGYGNATVKYRVFAHSIPLDPSRTAEFVILPANANIHIFDMAIAP